MTTKQQVEEWDHYVAKSGDEPAKVWMVDATLEAIIAAVGPLQERIKTLEARLTELEARPAAQWRGIWSASELYPANAFVTRSGGMWYSKTASIGRAPGTDADAWVLVVKRGDGG